MTRERIYRAKTTPKENGREFNNIWVFGDLIISGEKYYIHPRSNFVQMSGELGKLIVMHEVIPETICLGTELPDATGKEIFEGDIVSDEKCLGIIKYGVYDNPFNSDGLGGHMGFYIEWQEGRIKLRRRDIMFWADKVEVIGNVHDNPELLKRGETD